jgi:hypothetical protein
MSSLWALEYLSMPCLLKAYLYRPDVLASVRLYAKLLPLIIYALPFTLLWAVEAGENSPKTKNVSQLHLRARFHRRCHLGTLSTCVWSLCDPRVRPEG